MKRVCKSKEPSVSQIERMSSNLREAYNTYASVEVETNAYISSPLKPPQVEFVLYIRGIGHRSSSSWEKCQEMYFKLIKEASHG